MSMLTGKWIIVATTLRVSYKECPMVVFWQQQLLLRLYALYLAKVPSVTDKTTGDYSVHHRSHELGGCWSLVSLRRLTITGSGQPWMILEPGQPPSQCVNWSLPYFSAASFVVPQCWKINKYGNDQWRTHEFFSGGGSTNSVEDRENGDLWAVDP